MFDRRTVRNAMKYLYRGAVYQYGYEQETVDELLLQLEYLPLAAALRNHARRVYAFETHGENPLPSDYNGRDLFGKRAALLCENEDVCESGEAGDSPIARRSFELWLKEDGCLVTAFCVKISFGNDEYEAAYREIRGFPWGEDVNLSLNMEALTAELREMYVPAVSGQPQK
ncbi:MAG: hypothetical protein IJT94_13265 [Oscillibacter sp.]|nr:hypothetical protein [Oscillibacter sp.]